MIRSVSLLALLLLAGLTFLPPPTHAQFVYGISGQNDVLIQIDRSTGAAAVVGPLGFDGSAPTISRVPSEAAL